MASYADKSIGMKAFALMAPGTPYGEKSVELMSLERKVEPERHSQGPGKKLDANGFDIGALREMFNTHAEARDRLKLIQKGRLTINEFRHIDPQSIRIHEMMFDVHAVDFTDDEREMLPVLGALDKLRYDRREIVKNAFPLLKDMKIAELSTPEWKTKNGDPSSIVSGTYVRVHEDVRKKFDALAGAENALITGTPPTAQDVFKSLYPGSLYNCGLHGVAEDVGKTLLNMDAGVFDTGGTEILLMRVYDLNSTYKPEPKKKGPPPLSPKQKALLVLAQAEEPISRTILEALRARGVDFMPHKEIEGPNGPSV